MKRIMLLNTNILTDYGTFEYSPIDLESAKKLLRENRFESAIGHQSTSDILSEILQIKVEVNRTEFFHSINDIRLFSNFAHVRPKAKF